MVSVFERRPIHLNTTGRQQNEICLTRQDKRCRQIRALTVGHSNNDGFSFTITDIQLDLLDSVSASIELTQTVKQDLFLSSPPASSRNTAHTRLAGAVALTIHFAVQSGVATDAHVCPCDRA